MRAPSVGFALSAVEIRLFMWRRTVERPSSYGWRGPQPRQTNIRDTAPASSTRWPAPERGYLAQVARGPGEAKRVLGQELSISIRAERG
jgi:hypothetical protein